MFGRNVLAFSGKPERFDEEVASTRNRQVVQVDRHLHPEIYRKNRARARCAPYWMGRSVLGYFGLPGRLALGRVGVIQMRRTELFSRYCAASGETVSLLRTSSLGLSTCNLPVFFVKNYYILKNYL